MGSDAELTATDFAVQNELDLVTFDATTADGRVYHATSPAVSPLSTLRKQNRLVRAYLIEPISEHANTILHMSIIKLQQTQRHQQVISTDELRKLDRYKDDTNLHRVMKRAGQELNRRLSYKISVRDQDAEHDIVGGGSVVTDWYYNRGSLYLDFNPKFLALASHVAVDYTILSIATFSDLKSIYSQQLYQLFCMHADYTGKWSFMTKSHEELRRYLVGEKGDRYSCLKDFKRHVLDPAIEEINRTEVEVTYAPRKRGKQHIGYTFKFRRPHPERRRIEDLDALRRVLAEYISELGIESTEAPKIVSAADVGTILDGIAKYQQAADEAKAKDADRIPSPGLLRKAIEDGYVIRDADQRGIRLQRLRTLIGQRVFEQCAPEQAGRLFGQFEMYLRDQHPNDHRLYQAQFGGAGAPTPTVNRLPGKLAEMFYRWVLRMYEIEPTATIVATQPKASKAPARARREKLAA